VQVLRPALYVLLVLSALFTFWSGGPVAGRTLPRWTQSVAPTLFAVFLLIFAVYRFRSCGRRSIRRPPALPGRSRALIWVLLCPRRGRRSPRRPRPSTKCRADDVAGPARAALAVEVAGYRGDGTRYAPELIDRLEDADAAVRNGRTWRWCVSPERTWAGIPEPGASWPGNAVVAVNRRLLAA